jgi:hypothetical protein
MTSENGKKENISFQEHIIFHHRRKCEIVRKDHFQVSYISLPQDPVKGYPFPIPPVPFFPLQ